MQTLTGQIKKINRLSGQLTTPRAAPGGSEFKEVYIDVLTEQFSETLPMTFTTTAEALEDYCIYGNNGGVGEPVNKMTITLQDGTTINGITATVNNGTIVLNGTATARTFFVLNNSIDIMSGDRLIGCPAGGGHPDGYSLRASAAGNVEPHFIDTGSGATVTENLVNAQVMIRIASGVTCNNLTFKPVLYSDCPLPINVRGKNLFDKSNAVVAAAYPDSSTGKVIESASATSFSLVVPIAPGSYIFSMYSPQAQVAHNRLRAACYSSYPNSGTDAVSSVYSSGVRDGDYVYLPFTAPDGAAYALIFLWSDGTYAPDVIAQIVADNSLQVESGTAMTAYEPYFNETVTINLDFPLYYDDVVTMSDAGVTIPTAIGTNTLTVETTVQPAAVQVKYQS